jgi:hypothetical protein
MEDSWAFNNLKTFPKQSFVIDIPQTYTVHPENLVSKLSIRFRKTSRNWWWRFHAKFCYSIPIRTKNSFTFPRGKMFAETKKNIRKASQEVYLAFNGIEMIWNQANIFQASYIGFSTKSLLSINRKKTLKDVYLRKEYKIFLMTLRKFFKNFINFCDPFEGKLVQCP